MMPTIRTTVDSAAFELIIAKTPSSNRIIEDINVRSVEALNFENERNMPFMLLIKQVNPMKNSTDCGFVKAKYPKMITMTLMSMEILLFTKMANVIE